MTNKTIEALALCEFVNMITLNLHVHRFVPPDMDQNKAKEILVTQTKWSEEAYDLVVNNCEALIYFLLRERILPSWIETAELIARSVPILKETSVITFLPWALGTLAELHKALGQLKNQAVFGMISKDDLSEADAVRPDLVKRLQIEKRSLKSLSDWLSVVADFELLADIYDGAKKLLAEQQEELRKVSLGSDTYPHFSANSLLKLAAVFKGAYVASSGTKWPESLNVADNFVLTREELQTLVRDFSPKEILRPRWLGALDEWVSKGLCLPNTSARFFYKCAMDRVDELLDAYLSAFGDSQVESGFAMQASNWELVDSRITSNLEARPGKRSSSDDEQTKFLIRGTLSELLATYRKVSEKLLLIL
jgi:hypothetical protein